MFVFAFKLPGCLGSGDDGVIFHAVGPRHAKRHVQTDFPVSLTICAERPVKAFLNGVCSLGIQKGIVLGCWIRRFVL